MGAIDKAELVPAPEERPGDLSTRHAGSMLEFHITVEVRKERFRSTHLLRKPEHEDASVRLVIWRGQHLCDCRGV